MKWVSELIPLALLIMAFAFLLTVLLQYWKSENGLKKGSIPLSLIGIMLLLIPTAKQLNFTLGKGQISYISSEQQFLEEQITSANDYRSKLDKIVSGKLARLEETASLNSQVLRELRESTNDTKVKELIVKQKSILQDLPPTFPKYSVTFNDITFDRVCERLNSNGEFYYSFMVNGLRVIHRPVEERIDRATGESEVFSNTTTEIQATSDNDQFSLAGFINEYDGKLFFGKGFRYTKVGEVNRMIALSNDNISIPVGNSENSSCRATLNVSIKQLSEDS